MKAEELIKYLPEEPKEKNRMRIKKEALSTHLKTEYLIFKAETIKINPDYFELLESDSKAKPKSERAAHCVCTACGNEFYTGWINIDGRTRRGIRCIFGEDGRFYPGIGTRYDFTEIHDGEILNCPYCDEKVHLYHSSRFSTPRINQVAVTEIMNIRKQTVMMTWLVQRTIDRFGKSSMSYLPFGAVALINNKLYSYKHYKSGMFGYTYQTEEWYRTKRFTDPTDSIYYDCGSYNNKMRGSMILRDIPNMKGSSAEKTGLSRYITKDGNDPVTYLKLWRRYPNVENLIMTGYDHFVISATSRVAEHTDYFLKQLSALNWKKSKPHEILRMSKSEYKEIAPFGWLYDHVMCWCECQSLGLPITALELNSYISRHQYHFITRFCNLIKGNSVKAEDFKKTAKYLEKQKEMSLSNGIQTLVDHWNMKKDFNESNGIIRDLTEEEKFPKSLFKAHEEDMQHIKNIENQKLQNAFDEVHQRFSAIEWHDKEFCVILPRSEAELKREGAVLRHCVGSYGKYHVENKPVFFIRHYRRPERSYYTLNIDCTGQMPREIQLHGYGNERHGDNKEYSHTIPKKVRDFVTKWEKEILTPWYKKEFKKKSA